MREMKYIIYDNSLFDTPVIFDNARDHSDMAATLNLRQGAILSAGMIRLYNGEVQCYGHSHSLQVKSRPEIDSKLISRMLGVTND